MDAWIKGMDLSFLPEVEHCGGKFYDHGKQGDAMAILKSYGMNLVRLRLWNDPFTPEGVSYGGGGCDIGRVLAMAGRARDMGIGWMLDFHYSDCWADPGKQVPPKAWQGLDADGMAEAVYEYTAGTLARCRREHVLPRIVAVGNEVTNGLLWPLGKVPAYGNIARFIGAGIRAVRDAAPGVTVMVHLDNGGDNALYRGWFDAYFAHGGEDFDYIGLSYYPFWHGTPGMLRENMNDIALRYGKDLILAEVSMGHTLRDYREYEKLEPGERKGMAATKELAAKVPFAMTPEGQTEFMRQILTILREVPEGRGRGFCYWEPAWLPVPGSGWASPEGIDYMGEKGPGGNEWANQALFDYDGSALPALEVIRDFVP